MKYFVCYLFCIRISFYLLIVFNSLIISCCLVIFDQRRLIIDRLVQPSVFVSQFLLFGHRQRHIVLPHEALSVEVYREAGHNCAEACDYHEVDRYF